MKWTYILCMLFLCARPAFASEGEFFLSSDATWKSTTKFSTGWEQPDFNDSSWQNARSPTAGMCALSKIKPMFTTPMWTPIGGEYLTAYFRKSFVLSSAVQSAKLTVLFDDDGDVYVNGEKVFSDGSGKAEIVPATLDISGELYKGSNTLAIKVRDTRGGCQWAQVRLEVVLDSGVSLDVSLLKQTDPRWAAHVYDAADTQKLWCGRTVADCGCALASVSMLLQYYGVTKLADGSSTLPDRLNEYFQQGLSCGESVGTAACMSIGYIFGNVRWSAVNRLSREAHEAWGTPKIQYIGGVGSVSDNINAGRPVIAKMLDRSHWFVVDGLTQDRLQIKDPLYANTEATATALIRQFEKVNSDFSQIEVYSKDHILVTDVSGRQTGLFEGSIVTDIPRSTYETEPTIQSDATSSAALWVARIVRPENGTYTVKAASEAAAIYISDINAREKMLLAEAGFTMRIAYDALNIDNSAIVISTARSCSLANELVFPVRLELVGLGGIAKVYEGEVRVQVVQE